MKKTLIIFFTLLFSLTSFSLVAKEMILNCEGAVFKYVNTTFVKKVYLRNNAKWKEWCSEKKGHKINFYDDGLKCESKNLNQIYYLDFLTKKLKSKISTKDNPFLFRETNKQCKKIK